MKVSKTTMIIRDLYESLIGLPYLLLSKHTIKNKIKILFALIKIITKRIFFNLFIEIKNEHFLGYKVSMFKYHPLLILFQEIFLKNEYLFTTKSKKPLIIDCGSNIGLSVLFFKFIYPTSIIYAFEPDPTTYKLLNSNIKDNNLTNINTYNKAISDTNTTIDFFIDNKEKGSLRMSTNENRIEDTKRIKVKAIRLSKFIKENINTEIDYLKIDVEGSELKILKDLKKEKSFIKIKKMGIEYHHKIGDKKSNLSAFLRILEENGYEYSINTRTIPMNVENAFQDISIFAYKKNA